MLARRARRSRAPQRRGLRRSSKARRPRDAARARVAGRRSIRGSGGGHRDGASGPARSTTGCPATAARRCPAGTGSPPRQAEQRHRDLQRQPPGEIPSEIGLAGGEEVPTSSVGDGAGGHLHLLDRLGCEVGLHDPPEQVVHRRVEVEEAVETQPNSNVVRVDAGSLENVSQSRAAAWTSSNRDRAQKSRSGLW